MKKRRILRTIPSPTFCPAVSVSPLFMVGGTTGDTVLHKRAGMICTRLDVFTVTGGLCGGGGGAFFSVSSSASSRATSSISCSSIWSSDKTSSPSMAANDMDIRASQVWASRLSRWGG